MEKSRVELLYSTRLYSTLPCCTLLFSFTSLYSTLLCSILLYSFILLYSTLRFTLYSSLFTLYPLIFNYYSYPYSLLIYTPTPPSPRLIAAVSGWIHFSLQKTKKNLHFSLNIDFLSSPSPNPCKKYYAEHLGADLAKCCSRLGAVHSLILKSPEAKRFCTNQSSKCLFWNVCKRIMFSMIRFFASWNCVSTNTYVLTVPDPRLKILAKSTTRSISVSTSRNVALASAPCTVWS